jgi:hypothetical protein
MTDDDDVERKVNDAFGEADPVGAEMRAAGFREILPGDPEWIEVAEAFDPIRIVKRGS